MNKKYYLIGFNGWVEIRAALNQPTLVKGEFKKKIKEKVPTTVWKDDFPTLVLKEREAEYQIKNVAYVGGKVVGVISTGRCEYLLGTVVGQGNIRELDSDRVKLLREKGAIN